KAMDTDAQDWENTYYGAGGAKGVLLLAFKKDSLRKYIGKTLEEVAKIRVSSPEETAMNLIVEDSTRIGVAYFSMDSNNVKKEIVNLDPETVKDNATFAKPHQYASGMIHVFVNGVQVLKDGEHTHAKPGRFVKGPGWKMKN